MILAPPCALERTRVTECPSDARQVSVSLRRASSQDPNQTRRAEYPSLRAAGPASQPPRNPADPREAPVRRLEWLGLSPPWRYTVGTSSALKRAGSKTYSRWQFLAWRWWRQRQARLPRRDGRASTRSDPGESCHLRHDERQQFVSSARRARVWSRSTTWAEFPGIPPARSSRTGRRKPFASRGRSRHESAHEQCRERSTASGRGRGRGRRGAFSSTCVAEPPRRDPARRGADAPRRNGVQPVRRRPGVWTRTYALERTRRDRIAHRRHARQIPASVAEPVAARRQERCDLRRRRLDRRRGGTGIRRRGGASASGGADAREPRGGGAGDPLGRRRGGDGAGRCPRRTGGGRARRRRCRERRQPRHLLQPDLAPFQARHAARGDGRGGLHARGHDRRDHHLPHGEGRRTAHDRPGLWRDPHVRWHGRPRSGTTTSAARRWRSAPST